MRYILSTFLLLACIAIDLSIVISILTDYIWACDHVYIYIIWGALGACVKTFAAQPFIIHPNKTIRTILVYYVLFHLLIAISIPLLFLIQRSNVLNQELLKKRYDTCIKSVKSLNITNVNCTTISDTCYFALKNNPIAFANKPLKC